MDKEIIKVSLLVPIYMVEKYIEKCLQSIFEQTYLNIEYVFVNDCTQDKSIDILKNIICKYPNRRKQIIIINNTKNEGIAKVRNQCLEHATGDYILFIDSDDWIEKNMIEIMTNKAKETNADIVGCGYYEEYNNYKIPFKQLYPSDHLNAMKAITLLTIKGVLWKLLVKKRLYTDNNIKFIPNIQIGEDYIVCCKLFFYSKKLYGVDNILYHYVKYNPNNYSNQSINNIKSQSLAIKEVELFYKKNNIYEYLKDELNTRKFILKMPLIINRQSINIKAWRNLFPESNKYWRKVHLSLKNKCIFILANSSFYKMLYLIK